MKKFTRFIFLISSLILIFYFTFPFIELFLEKDKTQLKFEGDSKRVKLVSDIPFSKIGEFLAERALIEDTAIINALVFYKNYELDTLKAGKYLIKKKWSNNKLVNQLYLMRNQNIIDLYVPSVRNIFILAGKVAKQTKLDSISLVDLFNDKNTHEKLGFSSFTFPTFFLPNTFEIYANINEEDFMDLMANAYKKFWNLSRIEKANKIGLSQSEVTVLASIVQMEQQVRMNEHAKIAGLYINRLKKGMKLQADPTVKFALNQPKLKRVLNRHLKYDSPYNTYMYTGLPPGPICIPEITVIDAVLNYEKHNYIYMCAEPTYSGKHNFAVTYKDHMKNYQLYKNWLNQEGIR